MLMGSLKVQREAYVSIKTFFLDLKGIRIVFSRYTMNKIQLYNYINVLESYN